MGKHPYIKLVVDSELDPSTVRQWREIAFSALPSGLPGQTEIIMNGEPKATDFYKTNVDNTWCYIVPLTRDPEISEVVSVVKSWNKAYPDGDFEIDYSTRGAAAEVYREVEINGLKQIAFEAAKRSHNSWLEEMTDNGWRYGTRYSQRERTNPNMLPWEQVNKKYRLHEMRRFEKLMEILHNMKLQLVRK